MQSERQFLAHFEQATPNGDVRADAGKLVNLLEDGRRAAQLIR